jgi:uncharacterized membrane protein YeaQ/YmgE (transglycosylase-associated protein family)
MKTISDQFGKIKANPIGAIAGGVAFYYGAKKMGKVNNMYALIGLGLVGAVVGAMVQSKVASKGAPTIKTVK